MGITWTEQELKEEWQYVYDERLALLGCYGKPTPEQDKKWLGRMLIRL